MLDCVLCSSRCLCFVCVFDVFLPDICLVCAYGVFLLVKFQCVILLHMGYGRSVSVLRILPAWYSMLVNVLFASCMSVGGCIAVKAYSD